MKTKDCQLSPWSSIVFFFFLWIFPDAEDSFCIPVEPPCPITSWQISSSHIPLIKPTYVVQTGVRQKWCGRVGWSCSSDGDGTSIRMGRWMGESELRVYRRCSRVGFFFFFWLCFFVFVFLGRQGSGKAPLEDQRHSQKCPEGNIIQRSGREKQARTEQKTKKRNTNSSLK